MDMEKETEIVLKQLEVMQNDVQKKNAFQIQWGRFMYRLTETVPASIRCAQNLDQMKSQHGATVGVTFHP